ncbi:hypothetical protein PHSY_004459 [Pseudozyma hubeiensis SY62]|uniref:RPA43 OB domain-containing protein n=1 Tax=Pseudozyma hubeiensis (strain SY62) TaxID=1305764 RepID=R9PFN4_PSEHS|nr:hypothetical protein PHSY_004459 [Pseudozyma hubeiensis SY62]GAC96875.1 hypothetical protein PHSY_004459 [Pseudozyma hubeiensis SY62]
MSKDHKSKDKSKRRESKSGSSSSSSKSRKSSSSTSVSDLPITLPSNNIASDVASTSAPRTVTTAFSTLYPILNLPIPPVWSSDPYSAFSDLMDTLVMRYVPQLSGVLITHSPTRFLQDTAVFSADSAFATAAVGFECVVWTPRIGQMLEGNICLSSPSHVSLLLYGLFNASIPASHLPAEFEFVLDDSGDQGMGFWKSKIDNTKLGGSTGKLQFTVISLTIANHMLSLHGSMLDDPFSSPLTLDRSYLKKSLLPTQAFGLGSTSAKPTNKDVEKVASPRRVRWQDEDDTDAVQSDDPSKYDTPEVVKVEEPVKVVKEKKSKRKSTGSTAETEQQEASTTDSPKREKKRRKEA